MKLEWRVFLDTFSVVAVPLAGLYQWWNARFRSQLKADFEILESLASLGREEDNYKIVKAHVDSTITKAYACGRSPDSNQPNPNHVNRVDFILSAVFFLGAALWTWELVGVGINWRRILIAVGFAFSGLFALVNVLHKKAVSQKVIRILEKESPCSDATPVT